MNEHALVDDWLGAVRTVNNLDHADPLETLGVDWTKDLIALLATSIRTLGVVGDAKSAAALGSHLPECVKVVVADLVSISRIRPADVELSAKETPDLLVVDLRGHSPREMLRFISTIYRIPVPVLVEFDPSGGALSGKWLAPRRRDSRTHILDVMGEEIFSTNGSRSLSSGCLAVAWAGAFMPRLRAAIVTRLSRRTGVPLGSRVLDPKPSYVRKVEVVSLQTASRVAGFRYERRPLGVPDFNIYTRKYDEVEKLFELAWCRNVDLIPHPAWKICVEDRYLVEELGYSNRNELSGMEYWPDFRGVWDIRRLSPQIYVPRQGGPFLLLGGDNAYYHWLLNWLPRLMAVDLMNDQLPPLKSLKVLVPHGHLLQVPQFLTLLHYLGVTPENVVHLHENAVWRFEELLVPSFFFNGHLSPAVANWYRNRISLPDPSTSKSRIIISRRDARPGGPPRRKVINEDEVAAALAPFGFLSYELSSMSIRQQVDLFRTAEIVVGPHGAGFANMNFSPKGAKALIFENSFNHTFMVDMVNVAGGIACPLVCEDVIDNEFESLNAADPGLATEVRRNRDMKVDVHAMLQIIGKWTH